MVYSVNICCVMWNLFTVGSLLLLGANQNRLSSKFNLYFLISTLIIKRLAQMFCFKVCFLSKHLGPSFLSKLNCHPFLRCDFLPVAGGDMLVWQANYLIGFFQHGTVSLLKLRLHHTFVLYTNISCNQTSKLMVDE